MSQCKSSKKKFVAAMKAQYGFNTDRCGHIVVINKDTDVQIRFKMQLTTMRFEKKFGSRWVKIHTVNFSALNVEDYEVLLRNCKQ